MAGNSFVTFQPTGQLDDTYATDAELAAAIATKLDASALNNYYTKSQSDGNYVASLTLGSTTTGSAGTGAAVTNSGTATNPVLDFTIPRGNDGQDGTSATVNIGTVSTGTSGSAASVTNSGTNQNATLDFVLPRGAAGQSASVTIGSVTTGDAGTTATVTNSGTSQNATLDFVLPRGNDGQAGGAGQAATVNIGTVSTGSAGSAATVTNSGSSQNATLNFSIPRGQNGTNGENATLSIGSVNTGSAGTSATVTNSGTNTNAVLDFQIPRGTDGTNGQNASVNIGTVTTGASGTTATVTNSGTAQNATLDFTIPKGDTGDPGAAGSAATVAVGTVTTGTPGTAVSVTNSGSSQNATLNFTIPRGSPGQNATLNVGTTTTGDAGSSASVTNSGTSQNATFNFTIPKGDRGVQGNPGTAATVTVGSVTTGSAGSAAQVTNSGTNQAAQLDFTIPRGDTGAAGAAATVAVGTVTTSAAGTSAAVTNTGTSQNATLNFTIPQGSQGVAGDDWESKLFIDDTLDSSGYLPYQARIIFQHQYPGHSDGYDTGAINNATGNFSTTNIYYTKKSLLEAFFNAVDQAITYVTRDAVYKSGSNYIYEFTKTFQTNYVTTSTPIVIGSAVGGSTTNTKLRQLLGLGNSIPNFFAPEFYYPTSIGTNKWRFTFPINIVGQGAEDAIFDEIGDKLKYGGLRGVQSEARLNKYVGYFRGASSADDVSYLKVESQAGTPYKRSGIAFGESQGTDHVVLEYNGNGGGTTNYFAIHSPYPSWTQIGGGINYIPDNGRTHFGSSSNPSEKVRVNGSFYASSGSIAGSDDRIKYNETDVVDALTTIDKLKPQRYEKIMTYPIELSDSWIPTDEEWEDVKNADEPPYTGFEYGEEYGFIAQDVRNIPELSFLVSGEETDEHGNQTTLGLNYEGIFTVAVKAIQELKAKNEALEARIAALEQ